MATVTLLLEVRDIHVTSIFVFFCRQFAATIRRPFAVRYNPYTQRVEVLDSTRRIATVVSELRGDLCIVSEALRRVQLLETFLKS